MKFYLGTHHATRRWFDLGCPLFASRRVLTGRKTFPQAHAEWALDSGGFTELSLYGEWRTSEDEYVADVLRFQAEVGHLAWVAPMDWMCETSMLEKTGLTVAEHQKRTVANFLRLRERLDGLVIPVLQGWERDDYLRCVESYGAAGVDLEREPLVGLGSVCRRQDTSSAGRIVRSLTELGLRLHGFGVKVTGLESYGEVLESADSMAWSIDARWRAAHGLPPLEGCVHRSCANCPRYALLWRDRVARIFDQLRLEVTT